MNRVMKKELSLPNIHQSIASSIQEVTSWKLEQQEEARTALDFTNALQAVETFPRPKTNESIKGLGEVLFRAVHIAGEDVHNWKLLVLTILHRRYHTKAPEAKSIKKQEVKNDKAPRTSPSDGGGHGERLIFYVTIMYLQSMAMHQDCAEKSNEFLRLACDRLSKLALPAGGTRDVCAIIEHLTYDALSEAKIVYMFDHEESKTKTLVHGLQTLFQGNEKDEPRTRVLKHFIQCAAELLDKDLALIRDLNITADATTERPKKRGKIMISQQGEMQSTINTFVPHRDRGSGHRNLAQKVAELLIWSNTNACKSDTSFMKALNGLREKKWDPLEKNSFLSHIHMMQTSIRRLRNTLNNASRKQGFSLCTSYQMDPSTIDLDMIRTGKQGDVQELLMLATKKSDARIIGLISNRFADPLKAVPINSIVHLKSNWIPLVNDEDAPDDVELKELKLKCQEASIMATIKALGENMKIPHESDIPSGKIVVASIDGSYESDGGAILVAAAYRHHQSFRSAGGPDLKSESCVSEIEVQLRLGEKDYDVSDIPRVMSLLDNIMTKETRQVGVNNIEDLQISTTKDVQNLIDRHIQNGDILILFASADVKLDQRVLTKLGNEGSQIHCHVND